MRKSRENPLEKTLSIVIRVVVEQIDELCTGILRKSSGFGVFAEIFSKNIVIPSKEIPFFGEAHPRFWAIIAKFGFFGVIRMARIETRITEYSVVRLFGSPE